MKLLVIILIILLPARLFAQRLSGIVIDRQTELPVVYANISTPSLVTITSYSGRFNLTPVHPGDTIRVSCVGYKPYKIAFNKIKSDTLTIYLQQSSMLLRDVNVKARHDFKLDSINLRKQYASVFNYEGLGLEDMFITVNPYAYVPNNYIMATNSTTTLISVNVLSLISLLGNNKAPVSKLQKTLLADEQNTYIDQHFSKQKITATTNLKGDSLQDFMNNYRPTISQAKKMTDYEMILYIKKSYAEFIKTYDPKKQSVFSK